jgi:hypothetical protein
MYFGAGSLIAVLVHQDAIVGARQDWLVRPVKRTDLLAAKVLLLLLLIQLPMLVAGVAGGVANRFALSQSLSASFSQNLYFLIGFTLPILAFASLTKGMAEALSSAFTIFVVIIALEALVMAWNGGNPLGPTVNTGIAWIPQAVRLLIYLLAASAILALQYLHRATPTSRFLLGAAILLCLLSQIVPWEYVFSWQEAIHSNPETRGSVAVHFDPNVGQFRSPVIMNSRLDQANLSGNRRPDHDEGTNIYLPLRISGMPHNSILKVDRAVAHIVSADGKVKTVVNSANELGNFEMPSEDRKIARSVPVYEPIRVRGDIYNQVKDRPVTLQVDYSITVLQHVSTGSIAAIDGNQRLPGLGWCHTSLNDQQTAIELRCLQIGNPPQCSNFVLENPGTGRSNPAVQGCRDDYAPYFGRYKPPDTIMHTGANLYFRDLDDLVHYPVDGAQIANSQVVATNYAAVGHFTTRLVIPGIRLSDWSAP